jgi:organic radical activating enzyme
MKIVPESKSCSLKGNQKLFILQNNQASSCCRAEQLLLDSTKSVEFYINQWNQEKQLLDQGIELSGCNSCWQQEHQGQQSYRQQNTFENNTIEIFLSNLCNQMCSYCSPKYSSEWQYAIQKNPFRNISNTAKRNLELVTTDNQSDYWINQLIDYVNSCDDDSVIIKLLGGEPLMQIRNLEVFKKFNLIKIKHFEIVTNLNAPNSKFLHWLVESFDRTKLKIKISIDATPEYNYVPRAKFDCNRFHENLIFLQKKQIDFELLSVLSVLSVFDLKNYLQWIHKNQFKMQMYSLTNPDCLEVQTVPLSTRQEILNSIELFEPTRVIRESLLDDKVVVDLKLFEQYNYLIQYFQQTNINPLEITSAEFKKYWTNLENKFKK